jgi:hypothetical protein
MRLRAVDGDELMSTERERVMWTESRSTEQTGIGLMIHVCMNVLCSIQYWYLW